MKLLRSVPQKQPPKFHLYALSTENARKNDEDTDTGESPPLPRPTSDQRRFPSSDSSKRVNIPGRFIPARISWRWTAREQYYGIQRRRKDAFSLNQVLRIPSAVQRARHLPPVPHHLSLLTSGESSSFNRLGCLRIVGMSSPPV